MIYSAQIQIDTKMNLRVSVLDHFRTETLTFSWIELLLSGTVLSHKDCIGSSAVAADHRKPARFHVWTPIDWKREAILPNITKTQTRMLSPSKKTNSDIESWTWISDVESWIDTRPPRAVFYFETRLLTSALHPKTWNHLGDIRSGAIGLYSVSFVLFFVWCYKLYFSVAR